ncbi:MAG: putative rane-associated protein [Parcubacteria group bacterium]|nr:putative rane-associated protein [Parcubacteria group bacterium]
MHLSLDYILSLLETYRYWVLFPIAVLEGPIVTIISGFLISVGYLYGLSAYVLIVAADTIGDVLHYYVGYLVRHGRGGRWLRLLRIDEAKLEKVENHFKKHPKKSVFISKFFHGVGGWIQVAAGVAGMPLREFVLYCLIGTVPKTFVLIVIGFVFGKYLSQIDSILSTASLLALLAVVFGIGGYVLVSKYFEQESYE